MLLHVNNYIDERHEEDVDDGEEDGLNEVALQLEDGEVQDVGDHLGQDQIFGQTSRVSSVFWNLKTKKIWTSIWTFNANGIPFRTICK